MRRRSRISGRRPRHAVLTGALLGTCTLALGIPTSAWAQSLSAKHSVDESFSSLHQALSVEATNLLADAQRSPEPRSLPPNVRALVVPRVESEIRVANQGSPANPFKRALERVQALRPMLEPILREEGIPAELVAVVLIESGGRTTALSPKGARGLWQLMPGTGRRYGLVVTEAVDERLDPYKSTHAAARYLRDLYSQFGSWSLALAAYNSGEDTVQRAIDRASSRDFPAIAHSGVLPAETQSYVPAVLNAMGVTDFAGATKPTVRPVIYARTDVEN